MRILLLGCNGQLGWELQRALAPLGELTALGSARADLTQPDVLRALLREWRPATIVNAAAYTAVDKAESEHDLARSVNAIAPGVLAEEASALGATLVHYSTDYVFDGSGSHARDEDSPTAPLSVYGRTKLEGEERIRASGCRHLILRTGWVYAARGVNFARTMLRLAAERDALSVIDDQIGAPTGAELLADVTAHALRDGADLTGTYHCVAGGQTSWHAYACFVIEWARRHGLPIKVPGEAVRAIPTSAYPTPAQRPLNSRLDTTRLQRRFDLTLPRWEIGVERMLRELSGCYS